jgi:hypothetical protein
MGHDTVRTLILGPLQERLPAKTGSQTVALPILLTLVAVAAVLTVVQAADKSPARPTLDAPPSGWREITKQSFEEHDGAQPSTRRLYRFDGKAVTTSAKLDSVGDLARVEVSC